LALTLGALCGGRVSQIHDDLAAGPFGMVASRAQQLPVRRPSADMAEEVVAPCMPVSRKTRTDSSKNMDFRALCSLDAALKCIAPFDQLPASDIAHSRIVRVRTRLRLVVEEFVFGSLASFRVLLCCRQELTLQKKLSMRFGNMWRFGNN
jgi:hypothetical protein